MIAVLVVIFISILVINIWNLFTLKSLEKKTNINSQLSDAKYYDLKAKIEFIIAIFSICAAVVALLGYNSMSDIKTALGQDIIKKMSKYDSLLIQYGNKLNVSDSIYKKTASNYEALANILPEYDKTIKRQSELFNTFDKRINLLNSMNILKQNYYIANLRINGKLSTAFQTFHFNKLKTNFGDNLPNFKKPPIVIPAAEGPVFVKIFNIKTTSFDIMCNEGEELNSSMNFNVIIFENQPAE